MLKIHQGYVGLLYGILNINLKFPYPRRYKEMCSKILLTLMVGYLNTEILVKLLPFGRGHFEQYQSLVGSVLGQESILIVVKCVGLSIKY